MQKQRHGTRCNGGADVNGDIALALAKKYTKDTVLGMGAMQGKPGKSAYEIACDNGFEGSEEEWLESLKNDSEVVAKYQKYVNTELDYGIFETTDMTVTDTIPLKFSSVSGNMKLDENGFIKLQKGKTYILNPNLYNVEYTTGLYLVDSSLNVLSKGHVSGNGSYIYNAIEDIEVSFISQEGKNLTISSVQSTVNVQEINRQITIDSLEHVNTTQGIEDTPIGHVISYMGSTAPKHYLICDGSEYNIGDYPYLAQHMIDNFGIVNYFGGDGEITFAVPDLRDEFLIGTTNIHVLCCIKYEPTYFINMNYLEVYNDFGTINVSSGSSSTKIRTLWTYTNDNDFYINIDFKDLKSSTNTTLNEGFLTLEINDIIIQKQYLPTSSATKLDFTKFTIPPRQTLNIKTNWDGTHTNCTFSLSGRFVVCTNI